jgi:hypothetical protein
LKEKILISLRKCENLNAKFMSSTVISWKLMCGRENFQALEGLEDGKKAKVEEFGVIYHFMFGVAVIIRLDP